MLQRLRNLFTKTIIVPIELKFKMEVDQNGCHVVRVFKKIGDQTLLVEDVRPMLRYNYKEEIKNESGTVVYTLKEEDRQTLLAIFSLNPDSTPDGSLLFQIEPPQLRYLRRKNNIEEGQESRKVQISDIPLKPSARIDYIPGKGLKVETGYALEGDTRLIPPEDIKKTSDGKYARLGNIFAPLSQLSTQAAELLSQSHIYVPIKNIPEFIQRDLVLIKSEFNAVLTDLANEVKVISAPYEPVVHVNHNVGGWLDFQISYDVEGFVLPHGLLSQKKDGTYIQVDAYTWVKIDPKAVGQTQAQLEKLGAIATDEGYRVSAQEFASLEEFIEQIGGRAELTKAYQEFLDRLTGYDWNENFQLPESIENHLRKQKIVLRPYQRAGIHWLIWLRENHLQGVLADDMGLGKTLQALCAIRMGYEKTGSNNHSLIVAPKSVLHFWERELRRIQPYIHSYVYHGTYRQKSVFNQSLPYIIFTTYDIVQRDIHFLSKIPFFYLVLDEATKIKNPDARRTQAIKALNASHRLALSGTPVENRPAELWSLFDFLMRGHLGKYGTFVRLFEENILAGDQVAAEQLVRRIHPFLLRRTKEQVARDLPEKIVFNEYCGLSLEQKQLYGGLQDEVRRIRQTLIQDEYVNYSASILPVLTRLKQICDHPAIVTRNFDPLYGRSEKYDWIMDKIVEILGAEEQVVVFSHFLDMLTLIGKGLHAKGISFIRIDGSTGDRQGRIDMFNTGKAKVALLSTLAAGYGITMTAANHVIHADRWWNPAVEDQATDRVHRIGQERTVYVYQILVEGTLEERIDTLLERKRAMANQIVGAAVSYTSKISREELLELLKPLD